MMKTILKSRWQGKRITVKAGISRMAGDVDKTLRLKIQVEETHLLPGNFVKGITHKANIDVINTMGGVPHYIKKILDDAARQEDARRTNPIERQLSLF